MKQIGEFVPMIKQRDIAIDILKGIGMLLVIIGHSGCIWPFYPAIYAFHMPLFFIVSGLFFSTKNTIWEVAIIESKRLILNYLYICIISIFFLFLLQGNYMVFAKSVLLGTTISNDFNVRLGPVWFLLALFWCRIIYRVLAECVSLQLRTIICTTAAIIILALSRWVWRDLYMCPYNLLQGVVCMFYYHTGVLFRKYNGLDRLKSATNSQKGLLLIISCAILLLSLYVFRRVGANMNLSKLSAPFLPIDVMNAIGLTLSLYLVIGYVNLRTQPLAFLQRGLQWCGEHSMAIFSVHCVEYQTTIPMVSKITSSLMEMATSPIQKVAILTINPAIQITICVVLVRLWSQYKALRIS